MLVTIILRVCIVIALVGSFSLWPLRKKWGFYPIAAVSAIIVIVLILYWTGRVGHW